MKLILHVGLPKTATTTIQYVMQTAKPELAAQGVLYPVTTKLQTRLVERSQLRELIGVTGPGSLDEALGWVVDEVREHRPEKIVISSERMSLISPGALARLHKAFRKHLPEFDDISILAYVRDPITWGTSLCQQRLKMGTTRLEEFMANPWPRSLEEILSKYVDRYGREAVTVRHMHPDHMINRSVIDDFMAMTGLTGLFTPGPVPTLNKAMTLHGAQVADVVALHMPRGTRKGPRKPLIRRLLPAIPGPRFVLPREVQARIVEASRGDVDYIRRHWDLDIQPIPMEPPDAPGLGEAEVTALALALIKEVQETALAEEKRADAEAEEDEDGT